MKDVSIFKVALANDLVLIVGKKEVARECGCGWTNKVLEEKVMRCNNS